MKNKNVIVIGGDGFCGWPTTLRLLNKGYNVAIIDNLSRRKIDKKLKTNSLTDIYNINTRLKFANSIFKGNLTFYKFDISKSLLEIKKLISNFKPCSIIHFGEQRSAPFSMIGEKERFYTVNNNVIGTHNICNAIIETDIKIHLIHLGTMGVYGYNDSLGKIPEGYLDINISNSKKRSKILYPSDPGSIYHMTKCIDQLIFSYYNKNWGIKVTDLHQGIVWGATTNETKIHKALINRFDYDGIYGTVLNRFITQALNNYPLTVYGSGGQKRAFIHITDTVNCILLALRNPPKLQTKVRIFNQISEIKSVYELAKIVSQKFGIKINKIDNPRKELNKNNLDVEFTGLKSLGFKPTLLSDDLINDLAELSKNWKNRFKNSKILNSPKW